MKDVWRLFCSQVSALRWWLLVWLVALLAWAVARWTYLTTFRESWNAQESYWWYGILALSGLLVAAVVHLHPPAERVAGWRGWPLRPWKTPAAQFLFVLTFLVLLPGAAEMAFLLHPRLDGFTGNGMTEWLVRSLWPLPVALGLAACSRTLRRFILDALIFAAIVVAAGALRSAAGRWVSPVPASFYKTATVFRWMIPCFYGAALLVWVGVCRQWLSKTGGRAFYFLTPPLYAGVLSVLHATSHPDPDYAPAVAGDAGLAGRIRIQTRTGPQSGFNVLMQMDGLKPEETADVELWKRKLRGDDFTINDASFARMGANFGDSDWNPWSGPSGTPEFREHTIPSVITVSPDTLKRIEGKACRFEATAIVSVQRSVGLARLPFRTGAKWEESDSEVVIEFIGTASDALQRGIRGVPKDSEFVTVILSRRFGHAAERWVAVDLVHIPSGVRMHYNTVAGDTEGVMWRGRSFTHSVSGRGILCYLNDGHQRWSSGGLSTRALSHPEEFEFIVRSYEPVGKFAQEITVEGFLGPVVPPQLVPLAELAIPDLSHPQAVESFFRTLERYNPGESYDGIFQALLRCGPDVVPALTEFVLKNPNSPFLSSVTNHARELNAALFKPERPDHRLAFFKGYGRSGLFIGADPSTPENNAALLAEGKAWVKEDPDNRLNADWLYQMRNENVPALYPAIRRLVEREGTRMPWRNQLNMPGLVLPDVNSEPVSEPRGPSPATEGEFYRVSEMMTGPQESYREAVKQGKEWASRVGAVVAASRMPDSTAHLWLKAWPEVSECPSDPKAARAWVLANADRLHFNPNIRRYELR
jgi:hypothetical protein